MGDKVGLVSALPAEGAALFGRKTAVRMGERRIFRVPLPGGSELLGAISGVGMENARSATRWLADNGCSLVIGAGVAGGLEAGIRPGDVLLPEEILEDAAETVQRWPTAVGGHQKLVHLLEEAGLTVRRGKLFTSSAPVLTAAEKAALHRRTTALAVDMESAGIARGAGESKVPFFILRTVCDAADRAVPAELSTVLDRNGKIRIPALLGHILRRPGLIAEMLHLRKDFSAALAALRHGRDALLRSGTLTGTSKGPS